MPKSRNKPVHVVRTATRHCTVACNNVNVPRRTRLCLCRMLSIASSLVPPHLLQELSSNLHLPCLSSTSNRPHDGHARLTLVWRRASTFSMSASSRPRQRRCPHSRHQERQTFRRIGLNYTAEAQSAVLPDPTWPNSLPRAPCAMTDPASQLVCTAC